MTRTGRAVVLVPVGVVAVLLAVTPGALAAPAPDPTCDFPAQTTVTYRPTGDESPARRVSGGASATVCEHTTGSQGMEPMLAVNRRGTLFMGIATDKGLYEDPGRLSGTSETYLLRSRDDGRTWHRIRLPGGIEASEGFPYVDPVTDRLFVTSLSADTTRCGQPVIHSDDEGETWTAAAERPGARRPPTGTGRRSSAARSRAGRRAAIRPPSTSATSSPTSSSLRRSAAGDPTTAGTISRSPGYLPTINGLCQGRRGPGRHGRDDRPRQRAGAFQRGRRRPADRVRQARRGAQQRHGRRRGRGSPPAGGASGSRT